MKYSLDKYKYYQFKNENGGTTISAVSSYAGRKVKGYAKCDPRDSFDVETGKQLAAARCNAKIAEKRVNRASAKYLEAQRQLADAQAFFKRMSVYYTDAVDELDTALEEVVKLEAKM
jgi:hypothetical protein